MTTLTGYINSDNVISIEGLQEFGAITYENSASVNITLYEADEATEVTGETWPVNMDYEAGSDGNYRATLSDTLSVSENEVYKGVIVADAGAGLKRTFYTDIFYEKG